MRRALRELGDELGIAWDAQTNSLIGNFLHDEDFFFEDEVQCEEGM